MGQSDVTLPPQMLTDKEKKKSFTCMVCKQSRTYGGWEDAEIFFENDISIHLGCFKKHYLKVMTTLGEAVAMINKNDELGIAGKSEIEILKEVKAKLQGCFLAE